VLAKYPRVFRSVVFAILNDKNAFRSHNPAGNVQPFADVFGVEVEQFDDWERGVVGSGGSVSAAGAAAAAAAGME
jgi:hypothetical protein